MTLLVLLGATGIGKTDLSINLAKYFGTEIVSADSRQIYKELDIGTAPPSPKQLSEVKHHFVKSRSIFDEYNAGMYETDALETISKLFETNDYVWFVGGSGLYIDAVCKGIDDIPSADVELRTNIVKRYREEGIESLRFELMRLDPEIYSTLDIRNPQRVMRALEICISSGKPYSSLRKNFEKSRHFNIIKIGLTIDRHLLYDRINKRVDNMMSAGLEKEARGLYRFKELNALKTVGYRELFDYFDGKTSLEQSIDLIKRNTRRYAKRQITWFARYPEIKWFHPDNFNEIIEEVKKNLYLNIFNLNLFI
ncbi:MAG: tRNA (adenosine(37)-N6)-dimethylallyltransferase MiaA [Prevotellaceae bacterium]|jgi:tRNA dimethylallyltransferase|nr:tRNA (adenosine(37)-N6)-dimethylallyltransferase MiaA [Prevotellaceae bacterium]